MATDSSDMKTTLALFLIIIFFFLTLFWLSNSTKPAVFLALVALVIIMAFAYNYLNPLLKKGEGQLPPKTKKRLLIVSGIVALAIIAIWLSYLTMPQELRFSELGYIILISVTVLPFFIMLHPIIPYGPYTASIRSGGDNGMLAIILLSLFGRDYASFILFFGTYISLELIRSTTQRSLYEKQIQDKIEREVMRIRQEKVDKELDELEEKAEKERNEFEEKQRAKGLEEFRGKWLPVNEILRIKAIDLDFENNFAKYSPYQFEELIQKLFEKMGYKAWTTPGSGDKGADVIAEKNGERVAIQVKKYKYSNLVTPAEVRSALGSMYHYKAKKAVVVTTSNFTVRAWEIADTSPVELWEKNTLQELIKKYFIEL